MNHAIENARNWAQRIAAAYGACDVANGTIAGAESSRDARAMLREHGWDGTNGDGVSDTIRQEMLEAPLSAEVRSGWQRLGETLEPAEYCLLLSTGGPALRLVGKIGDAGDATSAGLKWQDWGTPWEPHVTTWEQDEALLWFANLFCWEV